MCLDHLKLYLFPSTQCLETTASLSMCLIFPAQLASRFVFSVLLVHKTLDGGFQPLSLKARAPPPALLPPPEQSSSGLPGHVRAHTQWTGLPVFFHLLFLNHPNNRSHLSNLDLRELFSVLLKCHVKQQGGICTDLLLCGVGIICLKHIEHHAFVQELKHSRL